MMINSKLQQETVAVEMGRQDALPVPLVDQVIKSTWQADPAVTKNWLKVLVKEAMNGRITWHTNFIQTVKKTIQEIDKKISKQITALMHQAEFKKLEGSWRGVQYLVDQVKPNANLKIKMVNISKDALKKELLRSSDFDQSQLYQLIYDNEFGTPGGEPFAVIIGDYAFSHLPEEIEMLRKISNISAAAFAPFIAAVSPELFGFKDWTHLSRPRDLEKIFDSTEYVNWRSFRESDDARFVVLTLPRMLARMPYGKKTKPVDGFDYEEFEDFFHQEKKFDPDDYCWMNAAYALGTKLAAAYTQYGWCTAIRGPEGGGRVENLPFYAFRGDEGDMEMVCPTEMGITDRREAELGRLGFLPLCHYKNTNFAVFFGSQTLQKGTQYALKEATLNSEISTKLPYLMAISRFAHYLKVMGRDKLGSFLEAAEVESWLNHWINGYVNSNFSSGQDMKAKYPLAEAKIQVEPVPGRPGAYQAVSWLRPWLQLEELTASLRLVVHIPLVPEGLGF